MTVVLHREILEEVTRIGELRRPAEACGVILPFPWRGRQVMEMPNRSSTPQDSFEMLSEDIAIALEDWILEYEDPKIWEQLAVWHTHPNGALGPSKTDLDNKVPGIGNLVITLYEDDAKATWF